jgi:hypothetical protein
MTVEGGRDLRTRVSRPVLLLCLGLFVFTALVGCSQKPEKPGDYFPLTLNSYWKYLGEGNEFASFSRNVIYVKDNLAQVEETNPGTTIGQVFETTDTMVRRVYFAGEQYERTNLLGEKPNDDLVILKAPIKVGTSWMTKGGQRTIVAIDAVVKAPAGEFKNCLKVKIAAPDARLYEYYCKGVGLVKREFIAGGSTVTSTLESYEVK